MKNISCLQITFKLGYQSDRTDQRLITIQVVGDGETHVVTLPVSVFQNDFESSFDWMMREATNIVKQKCKIINASIALQSEPKV